MSLFAIAFLVALAFVLVGSALMAWAYLNPKWQRQDAYDAALPFGVGVFSVIGGVVLAALTALVWLIRSL